MSRHKSHTFETSDFPVYEAMLQKGSYGVDKLSRAFGAATGGDDKALWFFATAIYDVAHSNVPILPDFTPEQRAKTMTSVLTAFEELAAKKHTEAMLMSGMCRLRGVGCQPSLKKARSHLSDAWAVHVQIGGLQRQEKEALDALSEELKDKERALVAKKGLKNAFTP